MTAAEETAKRIRTLVERVTGKGLGAWDETLLDSALATVYCGFGDRALFPTREEKGAHLGYELLSNPAFRRENKQIGLFVMLLFLEINGVRIRCGDEELDGVGFSVTDGTMSYEELLQWVLDHRT